MLMVLRNFNRRLKCFLYKHEMWLFYISFGSITSIILETIFVANILNIDEHVIEILENCILSISSGILFYWLSVSITEDEKIYIITNDIINYYNKNKSKYTYKQIMSYLGPKHIDDIDIENELKYFIQYVVFGKNFAIKKSDECGTFNIYNEYYKSCNKILNSIIIRHMNIKSYQQFSYKEYQYQYILQAFFIDDDYTQQEENVLTEDDKKEILKLIHEINKEVA